MNEALCLQPLCTVTYVCTYLEHHWCGGGREVEALEEMLVRVVAGSIALDHDSLGRALLTNQQDRLQYIKGKSIMTDLTQQ